MENNYQLFECDLCHDMFPMVKVKLQENGQQYLCEKCSKEYDLNLMEGKLFRLEQGNLEN